MGGLIPGLPNEMAMECLLRLHFESIPNAILTCKDWMNEVASPEYLQRRLLGGHSQPIIVITKREEQRPALEVGDPRRADVIEVLTAYEIKTGIWSELPPIPWLKVFPISCMVAVVRPYVVVFGGWHSSCLSDKETREVYIYSFVSKMWRRGVDMPGAKYFEYCVSDSDRMVYMFEPMDLENPYMMHVYSYYVAKDEWTRLPDLEIPRWRRRKPFFLSGKLHFYYDLPAVSFDPVTRIIDSDGWIIRTEAIDPATWRWDPVCDRLLGVIGSESEPIIFEVAENGGHVYASTEDDVVVFKDGECKKVTRFPAGLFGVHSLVACNKHLVVIGYNICARRDFLVVYSLDLATKKWLQLKPPRNLLGRVELLELSAGFLEI